MTEDGGRRREKKAKAEWPISVIKNGRIANLKKKKTKILTQWNFCQIFPYNELFIFRSIYTITSYIPVK